MRILCWWLAASALHAADGSMKDRLDRALAAPAFSRAHVGVHVVDLASGRPLYQWNSDRLFVPASNAKLFTTALALMRLGPDHRFHTTILANELPDASGRIAGDLRLIGGGDPTLSGRVYPYDKDAKPRDPLEAIGDLAKAVAARGVQRIDGDIAGDDTAYVWEPYPTGWTVDDSLYDYGAPPSALSFNDNSLTITVRPGERAGEPARISFYPPVALFVLDNRVRTTAAGQRRIHLDRSAGARQLRLWGVVPMGDAGMTEDLAMDDPALYAATALYEALTRRGVTIAGAPVAVHRDPSDGGLAWSQAPAGVELARRASPSLVDVARVVNKVSQNLHAELLLLETARIVRGVGSRKAALDEMRTFLKEAGIPADNFLFEDGSGLSRRTLVTPSAMTRLLRYMNASQYREAWASLLPVGAEDGSLRRRFDQAPEARAIHAKTGSLSHVMALSGYAGDRVAFSIMVNNFNAPASEVRAAIDKMAMSLIDRSE